MILADKITEERKKKTIKQVQMINNFLLVLLENRDS